MGCWQCSVPQLVHCWHLSVHLVKIHWSVHRICSHILSIIFQLKAQIKTKEIFSFVFNLIHKSHHQNIFIIRISYAENCQPPFFFSLHLVKMASIVLLVLILTMYCLGAQMNGRPLPFSNNKSNNKFTISVRELFLRWTTDSEIPLSSYVILFELQCNVVYSSLSMVVATWAVSLWEWNALFLQLNKSILSHNPTLDHWR